MNNHYIVPDWPTPKWVHAYSTTRQHGNSKVPYDSFNLGYRTEDSPEAIQANRDQLKTELKLPSEPIWLQQVHSPKVICADNIPNYPIADASYTTKSNIVCIVLTSDCLPVLICDQEGTRVAAVHAGWRGLSAGVIETTLKALQIDPKNTLAWLGPAIGSSIFEVGEEVRQEFLQQDIKAQLAFTPLSKEGKWLANLYTLAKQRLENHGVRQVYGGGLCTYSDRERFFSHRRDQGKTGRMASLIWISK